MMMRLVEQGKVDLKAPVRKYLPDFKVRDENVSRDVTIWNLLTHTAGWEGQVSGPERGEDTLRNFTATVMPDLMQVAPAGGGVELQQRRLQRVGPRHRSGHRHVDQPRDRRAGLPAARPEARRHDRRRLHRPSLRRRARQSRQRAGRHDSAVLAVGERHGRRRRAVHRRICSPTRSFISATARRRTASGC